MENEIIEAQTTEIVVQRDPRIVLAEAKKAAEALMTVVSQKKKPVIINNEQYLEFEDWMTVAKFYGLTVKIDRTNFLDFGGVKGYEAYAQVIRADGQVVSSAEAMCLNDEEKWSTRAKYEYIDGKREKTGEIAVPLFQLRSMAQTRAAAKAFRNVLAWVVVLAGFKATPAEEMTDGIAQPPKGKPEVAMPQEKPVESPVNPPTPPEQPTKRTNGQVISEAQGRRLYAIRKSTKYPDLEFKDWLMFNYSIDNDRDILRSDYEAICNHVEGYGK